MCTTCGCEELTHDHDHDQNHDHDHDHDHDHHDHDHDKVIRLEIDVLEKSRREAQGNRVWLEKQGVSMINIMSAPGAGKTTLLERTLRDLKHAGTGERLSIAVIEGDQATSIDADRIRAAGAQSIQVNTGAGCHLDPHMVRHGLEDLFDRRSAQTKPPRHDIVIVENVGNLVCPALFDLGEEERVVLLSVPEGDDKPLKYPHMFKAASLVLLTKIDLLPYVPFDVDRFTRNVQEVNPRASILHVSALAKSSDGGDGGGLTSWYDFLRRGVKAS